MPSINTFCLLIIFLQNLYLNNSTKNFAHICSKIDISNSQGKKWPIKAQSIARQIVHNCVTCCKLKSNILGQIIRKLRTERVTSYYTFLSSGVYFWKHFFTQYKKSVKRDLFKNLCIYVYMYVHNDYSFQNNN